MPRLSKTNKKNINKYNKNKSKRNKSNIKNKKGGSNTSVNNTPKTLKNLVEHSLGDIKEIPMTTVKDFKKIRNLLKVFGVNKFSGNGGESSDKAMGKPIFVDNVINPKLPFCFLYGPQIGPKGEQRPLSEIKGSLCPTQNPDDQQIIPEDLRNRYAILTNKPEICGEGKTDEEWAAIVDGEDAVGASMSKNHQFIGIMDPSWHLFNLLTLDKGHGGVDEALYILKDMVKITQEIVYIRYD